MTDHKGKRQVGRANEQDWAGEPPYNPLDKKNLGDSVADALLGRNIQTLPPAKKFLGSGIYALYYSGDYEPYGPISDCNACDRWIWPIYVGRAEPRGSRKGGADESESFTPDSVGEILREGTAARSNRLYQRLKKHADTIGEVENLDVQHFGCRYLCVDDIWIPLGEALIVHQFRPLWNMILEGFGNKTPGKGRARQKLSSWDTIHPGRSFAKSLNLPAGKHSQETLIEMTRAHLGRIPARVQTMIDNSKSL